MIVKCFKKGHEAIELIITIGASLLLGIIVFYLVHLILNARTK